MQRIKFGLVVLQCNVGIPSHPQVDDRAPQPCKSTYKAEAWQQLQADAWSLHLAPQGKEKLENTVGNNI